MFGRKKRGHEVTADNCIFWYGDLSGFDLTAVCNICPKKEN